MLSHIQIGGKTHGHPLHIKKDHLQAAEFHQIKSCQYSHCTKKCMVCIVVYIYI